ncbi:MAG: hypothetical protein ABEJ68_04820 [Halobacteriaceae archaeon]
MSENGPLSRLRAAKHRATSWGYRVSGWGGAVAGVVAAVVVSELLEALRLTGPVAAVVSSVTLLALLFAMFGLAVRFDRTGGAACRVPTNREN